jgi:hypothetical protein
MIVRAPRPKAHFTIIANELLRNNRLSLRARGLLAMLLSYPDNWRTSAEQLAKVCVEGRDAIRSTLAELEAAGYILRRRVQAIDSGQWSTETVVFDTPQQSTEQSPETSQPTTDSQASDSQALLRRTNKKNLMKEQSIKSSNRKLRICGQCSGSGWKAHGKSISRCTCDAGIAK